MSVNVALFCSDVMSENFDLKTGRKSFAFCWLLFDIFINVDDLNFSSLSQTLYGGG